MNEEANILVRDKRHFAFFIIDNEVAEDYGKKVGLAGLGLYLIITRFAREGHSTISLGKLAELGKTTKPTIIKLLKELEEVGLIRKYSHSTKLPGQANECNEYTLLQIEKKYHPRNPEGEDTATPSKEILQGSSADSTPSKEFLQGDTYPSKDILQGVVKNFDKASKNSLPIKYYINTNTNTIKDSESATPTGPAQPNLFLDDISPESEKEPLELKTIKGGKPDDFSLQAKIAMEHARKLFGKYPQGLNLKWVENRLCEPQNDLKKLLVALSLVEEKRGGRATIEQIADFLSRVNEDELKQFDINGKRISYGTSKEKQGRPAMGTNGKTPAKLTGTDSYTPGRSGVYERKLELFEEGERNRFNREYYLGGSGRKNGS